VRRQPRVDAERVEHVAALQQKAERVGVGEVRQTHRALQRGVFRPFGVAQLELGVGDDGALGELARLQAARGLRKRVGLAG